MMMRDGRQPVEILGNKLLYIRGGGGGREGCWGPGAEDSSQKLRGNKEG